jgi:ribonucleotide reductase alpha subunit
MDGSGVILRDGAVVDNSATRPVEDDSDLLATSLDSDPNAENYRDVKQNERGIRVIIDRRRDDLLTVFGKATLTDRYLMPGEEFQDLFARVAMHYADDSEHAQRLYDYMSRHWFMPSTPVLSVGSTWWRHRKLLG